MGSKQSTSLRVDFPLYTALANLARERGTTITTQLERAIRAYLEEHTAERALPLLKRVVGEATGEAVDARLEQMEARLGALLGRLALLDATVLYTALVGKPEGYWPRAREWALQHVESDFRDSLAAGPVDAARLKELQAKVKALQAELSASQGARQGLQGECERLTEELQSTRGALEFTQDLLRWERARDEWAIQAWENQGLTLRRRPLEDFRRQFEQDRRRPQRRDYHGPVS